MEKRRIKKIERSALPLNQNENDLLIYYITHCYRVDCSECNPKYADYYGRRIEPWDRRIAQRNIYRCKELQGKRQILLSNLNELKVYKTDEGDPYWDGVFFRAFVSVPDHGYPEGDLIHVQVKYSKKFMDIKIRNNIKEPFEHHFLSPVIMKGLMA